MEWRRSEAEAERNGQSTFRRVEVSGDETEAPAKRPENRINGAPESDGERTNSREHEFSRMFGRLRNVNGPNSREPFMHQNLNKFVNNNAVMVFSYLAK